MSYAQPIDIVNRYPNRDLVQLTNEDPAATTVNTDYLQTFLNDASSEIDSYLESRLTLPLSTNDTPARLTNLCIAIAMYLMQSLRPLHDLEDCRKRYEDAISVLEQFRDGKLTLGLSITGAEPSSQPDDAVVVAGGGQKRRVFSRKTLEGM
jgi:phage gp36-like protein